MLTFLKNYTKKKHNITNNETITRNRPINVPETNICTEDFVKIITRIPKGKAAGPFGDITDIFRSIATHKDILNNTFPYAKTIHNFFNIIQNGDVPPKIKPYFTSSFVFGLHKDPNDLSKLRPVAVGGGWRRALTSTIVRLNNQIFTKHLMPYNFAIGVKGGTNFIYHTVTYEIEKYINRKEHEIEINPPTRCLISLDISNMFNEISRQKAMEIINIHFPHLSNYTNLLLQDPTHCWYLLPNGGWQFFEQEEGLPQGCPFSPVFAALVLHTIIQPIDKMLRKRAATRLKNKITGDDNKGGITNLLAYVDDLNCVIPHEDVYFFCNTFQKLATQIGLRLNEKKSVILTTTSGKSVLQYLPNDINYI